MIANGGSFIVGNIDHVPANGEVSRLFERFPSLAVVCLTGLATERERAALIEAGAYACLTKDQELAEIVAAVHSAAESARER